MEAKKLRSFTVGGSRTKLVVVGVGSGLDVDKLYTMATVPRNRNVLLAHNFRSLTNVADSLNNTVRRGLYYTMQYNYDCFYCSDCFRFIVLFTSHYLF